MNISEIQLQALRIPRGWEVILNKFFDLEPSAELIIRGLPNDDGWLLFEQTLLNLRHQRTGIVLDLGWVPYLDPDGHFWLCLHRGDIFREQIVELESRDKNEIVEKINDLLVQVSQGALD